MGGDADTRRQGYEQLRSVALDPVRSRLLEVAEHTDDADELSDTVRGLYRESRSRRLPMAAAAAVSAVIGPAGEYPQRCGATGRRAANLFDLIASIDDLSADKASFWATGRTVRPCEMKRYRSEVVPPGSVGEAESSWPCSPPRSSSSPCRCEESQGSIPTSSGSTCSTEPMVGHGAGRQGRLDPHLLRGVLRPAVAQSLSRRPLGATDSSAWPEEELFARYHDLVAGRSRLVRAVVSFFFALLAAAGVQSQWEEWLLFVNRQDFGITDPQFGTDIGFYLFQLPFLTYVVDWAFAAFIIIFILTVIAHYLNGGIRMAATSGERTTASVRCTSRRFSPSSP